MSTTNNESSARDKVQALLAEAIAIVEKMSSEEREAFRTSKTIREEPIDICERLDNLAQQGRIGYPICDDIAEAATEIRRLRVVNEKLAVSESRSVQRQIEADATVLAETQNARAEGFRAGIEAAALAARHLFDTSDTKAISIYMLEAAIRALADKPAPVWTQEELDAAKAEGQRLADYFRDAARKGG